MSYLDFIKTQPVINLGIIGSVSNGKSSVTKCLTGKSTQAHTDEKKRNITIRLGYANCKIFKCPNCEEPKCYQSTGLDIATMNCKHCNSIMTLVNHLSICDVPGHNLFMSAMMNGTSIMDSTILIESAVNKELPAPQTIEHLLCTNISKIPNTVICLNKLDLVKRNEAKTIMKNLKLDLQETQAKDSYIIPISASMNLNIDVLCQELTKLKPYDKDYNSPAIMFIVRSFNINKCGIEISNLKGGVIGGSIIKGTLNLEDNIIIKPGYFTKSNDSIHRFKYCPLVSKVQSINSEKTSLSKAVSGGLIGVQLDIDPTMTANDKLVGNILLESSISDSYKVYENLELEFEQFRKDYDFDLTEEQKIVININSAHCHAKIINIVKEPIIKLIIELTDRPICSKLNDYCTISIIDNDFMQILGRGKIIDGIESLI